MFGRATIRLGICPHSSCFGVSDVCHCNFLLSFIMAALWNVADHYSFALWILLSSIYLFFSLAESQRSQIGIWVSAILLHMVAIVRI